MTGPIILPPLKVAGNRFCAAHNAMIDRACTYAAGMGVAHVYSYPQFKPQTGALQRATSYKILRSSSGRIVRLRNRKKYAAAIDSGARAHLILPRRAKVLAFYSAKAGRMIFTRRVNHPGNRPYKFLYRAHRAAYRLAGQELAKGMAKAARKF